MVKEAGRAMKRWASRSEVDDAYETARSHDTYWNYEATVKPNYKVTSTA